MNATVPPAQRRALMLLALGALVSACADRPPLAPSLDAATPMAARAASGLDADITVMRRASAKYQDLDVAVKDGFVLLHPCEQRESGAVGAVYVHMGRLVDGVIDPQLPDALIYAPDGAGRPRLVGVEFAIPYSMWTDPGAPEYLGNAFQPEDEFGVWALHAWVWRANPDGMFAESHPFISCTS